MDISSLRKKIQDMEAKIKDVCRCIRNEENHLFTPKNILDKANPSFAIPHYYNPSSISIGAVDSGFISKHFFGMDIVAARPVGVIFRYRDWVLDSVEYIPTKRRVYYEVNPSADAAVESLIRLKYELDIAISLVEHSDILLFDGSLLPIPSNRIAEDSPNYSLYVNVLDKIKHLLSAYSQKKLVIGVVKDTKASKIAKVFGLNVRDSLIIDALLMENELTGMLPVDESFKEEWASKIYASYIRPSALDVPLRIEFNKDYFYSVIPIIFNLCMHSKMHAYPPPLIEADLRARFSKDEAKHLFDMISSFSGIKHMRRDTRPFR